MKESITSNPDISRESIEKALPDIKALLLASYQEQGNSVYTLDQSFEKVKKLCQDIAFLLKGKGISIEPTQSAVIAFFRKSNIVFPISPMAVGPGQYRINHPMYALGKSDLYDMSRIRFDSQYGLPTQKKGVSLSEVRESLVPDIREAQGFFLNGLTVDNSKTGESTILLFPDRINQNAKREGLGVREYRDVVATNEVSQAYFSQLIPSKFHGTRLAEDLNMPAPPNTTIHQLNEAFSDLCSLKFTKGGKEEMMRILQSNDDGYKLSKLIGSRPEERNNYTLFLGSHTAKYQPMSLKK